MRILVTGGCGFIGSHIVEHFQGQADIVVLDNLQSGYKTNIKGMEADLIEGSILDRDVVRGAMKDVDFVFHLAAMVSVSESMAKPIECTEVNTIGTLMVLEEAARADVKRVCLSTSAAIYGDNPVIPKTEDMIPEPKSPYAISKLDGEYYCKMFQDEGRVGTVCLRYFNVFGPRQDPGSQYAAAVPIFIDKALRNEPIMIFGDGLQTRDFIYVKDIVKANVEFTTQTEYTGVFNIAYGKRITINDLANKIIRLTNSTSVIGHAPERPGDVKHSMASVEKLAATPVDITERFDEGLTATIAYFKSR